MKRYLAALLISLPVLLTGCLGEDWGICDPNENCLLRFRYQDASGADSFTDNIRSVDLIFFDENGNFAGRYHTDEAALAEFRGASLALDAGEYYVVAWGNLGSETSPSLTTLEASTVEIEDGNGGLPVFYAPYVTPITRSGSRSDKEISVYRLTVPKRGTIERDLNFTRAHRSINVYIQGYGDPQAETQLQVGISHLAYAYDFLLRVTPVRRTHKSLTRPKETPEGTIPGTRVNTPYQEIEDEIDITITTTEGRLVCPVINLRQFLLGEGQPLDALSLHDITILVSFKDGETKIELADWRDNQVDPVW